MRSTPKRKNRKINIEFIASCVKNKGGELIDVGANINSLSKFYVRCKKGHVWETSGMNVVVGKWCPYCAKNRVSESDIVKCIEDKGGILEEDFRYKNSTSRFYVVCSKNHRFETYWSNIQSGYWCPYCARNRIDKNEILDHIKNRGGVLDSSWEYIDNRTKFWITCDKGHRFITCWDNLGQGHWCPVCSGRNISAISIKSFIESKKGVLDTNWEYNNNSIKFWITCDRGHRFETCWGVVQQGHWCPYCAGLAVSENYVINTIKSKGGTLPSDWKYVDSRTKFFIVCSNGHKFLTNWSMVNDGCWCPDCLYKAQTSFKNVIEAFFDKPFPTVWPKWLVNRKNKRLQLDGYNEEINVAFEYQGYQHYMPGWFDKKDKNSFRHRVENDIDKLRACKSRGVNFIVVPYYTPRDQWTDLIKSTVCS